MILMVLMVEIENKHLNIGNKSCNKWWFIIGRSNSRVVTDTMASIIIANVKVKEVKHIEWHI